MTEANRCAGALLAITRSLNHMCGIWGIFCVERKLHLLAAAVAVAVAAVMIDWKMLHIPVLCGHCHCGLPHKETDRRRFNCECYLSSPVLLLYDV